MATTVEIKGLEKAKRRFEGIARRMTNPSEGTAILATKAYKGVIGNFKKEQGPLGKWKDTQRGGRILRYKGRLRNSIRFWYSKFNANWRRYGHRFRR